MKTIITTITAAAALFLGSGVAHADAIGDAINSHAADRPGTVQYLNTARSLGLITEVGDVANTAWLADMYCTPPWQLDLTLAQWQPVAAASITDLAADIAPGVGVPLVSALNTLCGV